MTHRDRSALGLTLVEVLVATAILGTVLAFLSSTMLQSIRVNGISGRRVQTTQLVNYLGRRVVGGESALLPAGDGDEIAWGYGELSAAFPDLEREAGGFSDPNAYRASVTRVGTVTFLGAQAVRYDIRSCSVLQGDETCVTAGTFGPRAVAAGGGSPLLPGIN